MAEVAAHHGIVFIGFMAAGKTQGGAGGRRAARARGDRHRRPARGRARRADLGLLRARGRGRVPPARGAAGGLGAERPRGPGRRAVVRGGARRRRDRERGGAPRARRPHARLVRRRRGGRLGAGLGIRPAPGGRPRRVRASASPSRRPIYESLARAILPSDARDAAGPAAPWLAAMQGTPGVRMVWAESESGSYPAVVGEGAIGLLDDAREALPEALPARTFCVADDEALRHHRSPAAAHRDGRSASRGPRPRRRSPRPSGCSASCPPPARTATTASSPSAAGWSGTWPGFCAATYQRGVPLVQAPTTLVAQVDSAYGGKTGVDLPEAKNYVGAYHMPIAVLADPATLATLPHEELAAGFVEVVKTALIAGDPLWSRVREIESLDPAALTDVIFACARTKIEVVAADERDSGQRMVLNLGHTIGHAIEAETSLQALPPRRGRRPRPARGAPALGRGSAARRGRGAARLAWPARSRSTRP